MATNIDVTSLDFDDLKSSLKSYLKSQSQFQDYDFEGSNLSILIDLLAYNSSFTAFMANMLANEMFLDSAIKRDSVVSHAKKLNYTPTSKKAAKAVLNITFSPNDSPSVINIEKGTIWNSTIDNENYKFQNIESISVLNNSGVYVYNGLEIYEGDLLDYKITVDLNNPDQRFVIPNSGVDTETIKVLIQNSVSDETLTQWTLSNTINEIDSSSKVFWIQEVEDQKYELIFGDDVIGKKLSNGNIIHISYLVTSGSDANKASTFSASSDVGGYSGNEVSWTVENIAGGGSDIESIDSIKFLAPKLYQTQNRAVTEQDYKNILLKERPDIESINVWGGEENIPKKYGKVIIAIKPSNARAYSETTKASIINDILKPVNVVSITPEIVDADYTYFNLTVSINYDPIILVGDVTSIESDVTDAIEDYFLSNLNKFDKKFRFSTLSKIIDESNSAIKNNNTTFTLEKRFEPVLGESGNFTLNFNTSIKTGSLSSNQFTISGTNYYLDDDGLGVVRVYRTISGNKNILSEIGTIDYNSGSVVILDFLINSIVDGGEEIKVIIESSVNDLEPLREQILTIDVDDPNYLTISSVSD